MKTMTHTSTKTAVAWMIVGGVAALVASMAIGLPWDRLNSAKVITDNLKTDLSVQPMKQNIFIGICIVGGKTNSSLNMGTYSSFQDIIGDKRFSSNVSKCTELGGIWHVQQWEENNSYKDGGHYVDYSL